PRYLSEAAATSRLLRHRRHDEAAVGVLGQRNARKCICHGPGSEARRRTAPAVLTPSDQPWSDPASTKTRSVGGRECRGGGLGLMCAPAYPDDVPCPRLDGALSWRTALEVSRRMSSAI